MPTQMGDLRTETYSPSPCHFFHCKANLLVFCQVPLVFHIQDRLAEWKV